jgi:glycosyltransferase involved in cell wall biosynthesis
MPLWGNTRLLYYLKVSTFKNIACDVVTVCKDNSEGLLLTLNSLLKQDYENWRCFIVVPPGDSSLEKVSHHLTDSRIRTLRDSGVGIYNAMNQALQCVNSQYVWFMNAGDEFYARETLRLAMLEILEKDADLVIGDYLVRNSVNTRFRLPRIVVTKSISTFELAFSINRTCHQASLFRVPKEGATSLVYDLKYPLAADFNLMLKTAKKGRTLLTPRVLAIIEGNGLSDMSIGQVWAERGLIRKTFFPIIGPIWSSIMFLAFRIYSRYVRKIR